MNSAARLENATSGSPATTASTWPATRIWRLRKRPTARSVGSCSSCPTGSSARCKPTTSSLAPRETNATDIENMYRSALSYW